MISTNILNKLASPIRAGFFVIE